MLTTVVLHFLSFIDNNLNGIPCMAVLPFLVMHVSCVCRDFLNSFTVKAHTGQYK